MTSLPADPYKALGIGRDADASAIKTAYRKLVLKCHPDKVQDPALKATKQDEFQRVQQAYEILSDEKKRREYDEDVSLNRLRDELSRGMARSAATPRSSPKTYTEPHIRTAEPPPSFKPGPPPTSPFSPYGSTGHHFSHSWDRDIPFRTKVVFEEGHRARRTASSEKPHDEFKEERRRRKEDDDPIPHEWMRERDRDKDRERGRDRDRERERDRKTRSEREKDDKKEKARRETEKREKDRDRARHQDQQEKYRARKPPYVEHYDDSDEDRFVPKKKPAPGIAAAAAHAGGSSGRKHADSPRRDKTPRMDESPRAEPNTEKMAEAMKNATGYIASTMRRGSKSGSAVHPTEGGAYSLNFPDPDQSWHAAGDSLPARRLSQDDKKPRARADASVDADEIFKAAPEFRPPRLAKSYTSPAGALYMSNSSAPRIPSLPRAATMDYRHHPPPAAPAAPPPESGRHPSKPERHRRGSFDMYESEDRSRRSSAQPYVSHCDDMPQVGRSPKTSHYRTSDDPYYHHQYPLSGDTSRRPRFGKIKVARNFSREQVYEAKRYSPDDVSYSSVPHASYLHVRS